jgi:hypothetical protein
MLSAVPVTEATALLSRTVIAGLLTAGSQVRTRPPLPRADHPEPANLRALAGTVGTAAWRAESAI